MMETRKRPYKAPGKAHREGLTVLQVADMFPDEQSAERWFEETLWPDERCCGKCGSTRTKKSSHKTMPYWCSDGRHYFSVRTGTPLAKTNVPLRKWAISIYLELTSLKGVSSMKLHRDIGVSQPTAWFMLHRIREAWNKPNGNGGFSGPVEVDEAYMGGKRRNMSNAKRKALANTGLGAVGKTAVAGIKDRTSNQVRAQVVRNVKSETMCRFIMEHVEHADTKVYADASLTYHVLPNHESVRHSVGEYVRGQAHTNDVESFWAMLKRAHQGVFHKLSPKHLDRYVRQFAGKHNLGPFDTLNQMRLLVRSMAGKHLTLTALKADNGLPSGARS